MRCQGEHNECVDNETTMNALSWRAQQHNQQRIVTQIRRTRTGYTMFSIFRREVSVQVFTVVAGESDLGSDIVEAAIYLLTVLGVCV